MFGPWMTMSMLAFEAQQVIFLRTMRFALGGPGVDAESQRMVTEKIFAGARAWGQIMTGASPDRVMKGYRRKVRSNIKRLSR